MSLTSCSNQHVSLPSIKENVQQYFEKLIKKSIFDDDFSSCIYNNLKSEQSLEYRTNIILNNVHFYEPSIFIELPAYTVISIDGDNMLKQINIDKLEEYSKLEFNWNYYNAEPFKLDLINRVRGIIEGLEKQPKMFPTGRNSIQLEYYDKKYKEKYLEFEVFNNHIHVFCLDKYGTESEDDILNNVDVLNKINEKIRLFYE